MAEAPGAVSGTAIGESAGRAAGAIAGLSVTRETATPSKIEPLPTAITVSPQRELEAVGVAGEAARLAMPVDAEVALSVRPSLPLVPRRLTEAGCCSGAWWSDDSTAVHFVDRPGGAPTSAVYGVAVWPPNESPQVVDGELMLQSGATRLVVRPAGGHSIVEDPATGDRWPLPTGGNPVRLSPDGTRAVWWEAHGGWSDNSSLVRVFGSDVYGFDKRELGGMWGTRVVSFLPDSRRVMVVGRPVRDQTLYILATMDVEDGTVTELARGSWLSDAALSRGGSWVAYMTSMDRSDLAANGIWVTSTDGGDARKLDFVGAYRWRDDSRLVYVPMQLGADSHELWQIDVESGSTTRLLGPQDARLRIAGNEWSVSPDGASLVYLNGDDHSLWVVDLP
jgi:hypothetical protein